MIAAPGNAPLFDFLNRSQQIQLSRLLEICLERASSLLNEDRDRAEIYEKGLADLLRGAGQGQSGRDLSPKIARTRHHEFFDLHLLEWLLASE